MNEAVYLAAIRAVRPSPTSTEYVAIMFVSVLVEYALEHPVVDLEAVLPKDQHRSLLIRVASRSG